MAGPEAVVQRNRAFARQAPEWVGRWKPSAFLAGPALRPPKPLFARLDESVAAEELARMEMQGAAG